MGHYRSEMYFDDRSEKQIKEDKKRAKKKAEIKEKLFQLLGMEKGDGELLSDILKYVWKD